MKKGKLITETKSQIQQSTEKSITSFRKSIEACLQQYNKELQILLKKNISIRDIPFEVPQQNLWLVIIHGSEWLLQKGQGAWFGVQFDISPKESAILRRYFCKSKRNYFRKTGIRIEYVALYGRIRMFWD